MRQVIEATTVLFPDEAAWNLSEVNLMSPDGRGFHRYQVITVVRDDKLKDAHIDMGNEKQYNAMQFRIPALGCHTVAELRNIADYLRDLKPRQPEKTRTDLLILYAQYEETKRSLRHGNQN